MQWGVALVGGFIASAGLAALVDPGANLKFGRGLAVGRRLYGALLFRLVAGVLLVLDSDGSRWPAVVEFLGWAFIVGAVIGRAAGLPRLRLIVIWWADQPPWVARAWGLVATLLGVAILTSAI